MPEQLSAVLEQLIVHLDELRGEVEGLREDSRKRIAAERTERRRAARRLTRYGLVALVVVAAGLGGFAAANRASVNNLHQTIDGDCPAFAAIGTLDVPPTAAPILHRIIDSQRGAYARRCVGVGGPLPPVRTLTPSPTPSR